MNKKLLSLAVAAGLGSSSALAVVDLNAGTGTAVFATESTIAATGTTLENAGNALDIVVDSGFSISDSTARYMRFDFTGATFSTAVASADLTVDDSSGAGNANEVLSTGGALTGSSVVFEVTASAGETVGVTNDATLALSNVSVTDESGVSVTYRLYDNAVDAVNNATASALVTTTGTVLSFGPGNSTAAVAQSSDSIDVTQGATFFDGSTSDVTTVIGAFVTTDSATAGLAIDGATDVTTAVAAASSTLTVTGDFTFTQDLTGGAPDGTYTATNVAYDTTDATCANQVGAGSVSLTDTTAVLNTSGIAAGTTAYICVNANGVSTIGAGSYTGSHVTVANAGYDAETTALSLGSLSKNGSTITLNLALTPGGAFSNYVRVTNTSNITGDVSMTVISDSGSSVNIDLADVAGQSSSSLAGQASSGLVNINDIYDAAVAADATFDAAGGKLRLVVDGEFSSIDAQSITVSTDNTTFSTF